MRRLLWKMDIQAIYPKRNLSKLGLVKYKKPYLLRGLKIVKLNQFWAIDIVYIPMEQGFMYLTYNAIIECTFRILKQEYIYLNLTNNVAELKKGLKKHIEYFNTKRTHQVLIEKYLQIYIKYQLKMLN